MQRGKCQLYCRLSWLNWPFTVSGGLGCGSAGCVKAIWETVYCKKSVAYMSGDMNVIGCVHVHGRLSCMSNCLSIPVLQEAVY